MCTRTRESAGDYGAVNPAGYYGAYQFSQPTWDVTANHAGSPQLIVLTQDEDVASWARLEALTGALSIIEPSPEHTEPSHARALPSRETHLVA